MDPNKAVKKSNEASRLKILKVESGCFIEGIRFVVKAIRCENIRKIISLEIIVLILPY